MPTNPSDIPIYRIYGENRPDNCEQVAQMYMEEKAEEISDLLIFELTNAMRLGGDLHHVIADIGMAMFKAGFATGMELIISGTYNIQEIRIEEQP